MTNLVKCKLRDIYFRFFNWAINPEDLNDQEAIFKTHLFIYITISTGLLMWFYAFASYFFVNHISIKYTGFVYAIIHAFTPYVYKRTRSTILACNTTLIPGCMFQVHFSFVTGGFLSFIILWVGILPIIAGILTNKRHTYIWSAIAYSCIILIYICDRFFHLCPNALDYQYAYVIQASILIGMIGLIASFTWVLLHTDELHKEEEHQKTISKQNLLRVVVHDLSNPLTVFINKVYLMKAAIKKDPDCLTKLSTDLEKLSETTDKMNNIIDDVRNFEAIESGKREVQLVKVNLSNVIAESVENFAAKIHEKNLNIDVICDKNLMVWANKSILENQIINNILSNAIKFSFDNSTIHFSAEVMESGEVHLDIRDHGDGIPVHLLSKLFNPSAKTSHRGTKGEVGTGFGMPIALFFMKAMKGNIIVTSTVKTDTSTDHGTNFRLILSAKKK